ncbi:MAG: glucans biosynthesis glucosyltransferase MdoH, partial [Gammaproteobacteria bacterium]
MAVSLDPLSLERQLETAATGYGNASVPPPAPLAMPVQSLRKYEGRGRVRASFVARLARLLTFGGAAALTGFGTREMFEVVDIGGIAHLEWLMIALFAITFGWISLSAAACVTGVLLGWQRRRRALKDVPLASRTAVVMPVYNENPARTFAALQAMAEALVAEDRAQAFELFILSDTTNVDIWVMETA